MSEYEFTTNWFDHNKVFWDAIIKNKQPRRILEVGSFEGRSATYTVEESRKYHNEPIEIVCIDTWQGGVEHGGIDFKSVESRFDNNMKKLTSKVPNVKVIKRKGMSGIELAKLYCTNLQQFDWIYIDGSHEAKDVMLDAVLSFRLLRVYGDLIFDDYEYANEELKKNPHNHPNIAINAFLQVYGNKVGYTPLTTTNEFGQVIDVREDLQQRGSKLYQMYVTKIFE